MPTVTFAPDMRRVAVAAGTTLLEAARLAGILIEAPCDGSGTCGKCRVRARGDAPDALLRQAEEDLGPDASPDTVLACQTLARGDVTVEAEAPAEQGLRVHGHGRSVAACLDPFLDKVFDPTRNTTLVLAGGAVVAEEPGDTSGALFGLAVDIGTTTLVVAVVDLRTGRELATAGGLNPQALHGQDVLSRIRFASEDGGLARLHDDLVGAINRLAAVLGG
ncbi:MAG TPA: 2Fe-2S iron-sulfur cluster-binding protein, partial [Holophaga sp.]|nr:2Fe-2S iron-sulfur cluster-binding protein [Holophaga sp.]